ncbi:sigma-70 family RNA polymerase sigma factor, partial [Spirillospora sp. NPDC029432]|uniref:RNA polymerase sigma factor n=1 Tax=Spirillospora sp. NPDC029432 TaxID=3154599 RepID=UPI0034532A25
MALLYEAYAERLYDYTLSMTGEYRSAADIVHDTFIDACRRAPRMRDHARLRSWLYGAARRRCVQRGRARGLFWEHDAEFGDGGAVPSRADGPAARRDAGVGLPPSGELRGLLESSLGRLEPGEQEALLLAVRHGLLPAEIGTVLGVSARRAAGRVARARTRLDAAYEIELALATEHCAAGTRAKPRPEPEAAAEPRGEPSARTVVADAASTKETAKSAVRLGKEPEAPTSAVTVPRSSSRSTPSS